MCPGEKRREYAFLGSGLQDFLNGNDEVDHLRRAPGNICETVSAACLFSVKPGAGKCLFSVQYYTAFHVLRVGKLIEECQPAKPVGLPKILQILQQGLRVTGDVQYPLEAACQ